ncbi:MAG: hypothetical protein V3T31_06730 [candidate division Zixibacteria bacterium]
MDRTEIAWIAPFAAALILVALIILFFDLRSHKEASVPALSILQSITKLTIVDELGEVAEYIKEQTAVPNVDDIISYIERGLWVEQPGYIDEVEAYSGPVDEEMKPDDVRLAATGFYEVNFEPPLMANTKIQRKLSCKFIRAFTSNDEYFEIFSTKKSQRLSFELNCPERPLVGEPRLTVVDTQHTVRREQRKFEMNASRTRLKLCIEHPVVGCKYRISWSWK